MIAAPPQATCGVITNGGVAAQGFENADDRVAAPNRDPVGSNRLRRDLRLWLVARHQALVLLRQRLPRHSRRCTGSRRHRVPTTSRDKPTPSHARCLPTWQMLLRLKHTREHHEG